MTSADLLALAERVEQSTHDRASDLKRLLLEDEVKSLLWCSFGKPPRQFIHSLDAAETLKHKGDLWCVGSMEDGPFARVVPAMPGGRYGDEITVHAETVQGALTSAFLRAISLRAKAKS